MLTLLSKVYDGESIVDMGRDVQEAVIEGFNPDVKKIPQDEHGFSLGTFRVKIEWVPAENCQLNLFDVVNDLEIGGI